MLRGDINHFCFYVEGTGTTVVPGVSNAEGSWTEVLSAAQVTAELWELHLFVIGIGVSAVAKNALLDIGIDPAGGTSYTAIVNNLIVSHASGSIFGGIHYTIPIRIPAGSSVAARIQTSHTVAGTSSVYLHGKGKPSAPESARVASFAEVVGTVTNSNGVSVTPGVSGSQGAWTSLGTTSRDLWGWQLGIGFNTNNTGTRFYTADLAFGDASNKHMIINFSMWTAPDTAETTAHSRDPVAFRLVPAGSTLYVRMQTPSGTNNAGAYALAYGFGG